MKLEEIREIIKPETELEKRIVSDPDFVIGAGYGKPRPGHPEGQVVYHIREVLDNVEKFSTSENREELRLIALIHDTFKNKVDHTQPKVGMNHHAMIARKFAEKFIQIPEYVLDVIELHDEAYNAWQQGGRKGDWYKAEKRAAALLGKLQTDTRIDLYMAFYKCDNQTGDK
jgi:NOL1/NOP2/fmu family ribosome biogenesis protein